MRMLFLLTACTAMAAPGVKWSEIPLSFEPNSWQANTEVRYLARGSAYTKGDSHDIRVAGRIPPEVRM